MNIYTANKLLELRKKNNFSQEELAERLNISRQAISKWERAESSPDTDNLIALAKLYRISLDELLEIDVKTQICEENNEPSRKVISLKKETVSEAEELSHIFSKSTDYTPSSSGQYNEYNGENEGEIYPQYQSQKTESVNNDNIQFKSDNYTANNTAFQTNETNNNIVIPFKKNKKKFRTDSDDDYSLWYKFPYYAVATILFIVGISHPFRNISFGNFAYLEDLSWLWFLTIPLYYSGVSAFKRKDANYFWYPLLAVIMFLFMIIVTGDAISLSMLATIPFYYFFVAVKKKKRNKK